MASEDPRRWQTQPVGHLRDLDGELIRADGEVLECDWSEAGAGDSPISGPFRADLCLLARPRPFRNFMPQTSRHHNQPVRRDRATASDTSVMAISRQMTNSLCR